jgi:uncharacterized protein
VTIDPEQPAIVLQRNRTLSRWVQLLEVSIFLSLLLPRAILSLFMEGETAQMIPGFGLTAAAIITRDLAWAALVVFFVWRNAEPLRTIGLSAKNLSVHAALGFLLFPLMFIGVGLLKVLLLKLGLSGSQPSIMSALAVKNVFQVPLATLLVAVVALTEEVIFRGYLLMRLRAVTGHMGWAVFLSTLVFAIGHGYQGEAGLVAVGVMGLIFTAVYLSTGNLVTPVVMHFLQDFVGVVVFPLLAGKPLQ